MKLKRRREQRAATREEKELKRRQVSGELSDAKNAELTKNEATTFGLVSKVNIAYRYAWG